MMSTGEPRGLAVVQTASLVLHGLGQVTLSGLGSKTVLNPGSPRPTWRFSGSGGPGPRSTAQPGTPSCGTASRGEEGLRTRPDTPTFPAAWPRSASPHLVTPRAFAPAARPRASPRHVPHLGAEEPASARAEHTLCVRAAACVRARLRITCAAPCHSAASTPRLSCLLPSGRGRVPVARPRDGERGTWLLVGGP